MKCPNCGREARGKFCTNCGTPMPEAQAPSHDPSDAATVTFQKTDLEAGREPESSGAQASAYDRSEAPTVVFRPSDLSGIPERDSAQPYAAVSADSAATMRMPAGTALEDVVPRLVERPAKEAPVTGTTIRNLQRRLIIAALFVTFFGAGHHIEHVIRGDTGWPIAGGFTPFTPSLLFYPLAALGIYFTLRGRLVPALWLVIGAAAGGMISVAHLAPGGPDGVFTVVWTHYKNHVAGFFAVADVFAMVLSGLVLAIIAIRTRLITKRWW